MPEIELKMDFNRPNPNIQVSAPWGEFDCNGMLSFIQQCVVQLKSFGFSDTRTKLDIEGYEQVLATGREELAVLFLKTKDEGRRNHVYYENNIAVIDFLKQEGKWA